MNKLVRSVIKLVPTFQYFINLWNLNKVVDICLQFKYLSTRPCSYTQYIDYIQPIIFLPLENIITRLFIYSCGNRVILPLPFLVPLYVLFLWYWDYLIHFLCCFTLSTDKPYFSGWPPPFLHTILGCFNVKICYFVILDIDYKITLLKSNSHLLHELQTNYLHGFFSHLCYYILIEK